MSVGYQAACCAFQISPRNERASRAVAREQNFPEVAADLSKLTAVAQQQGAEAPDAVSPTNIIDNAAIGMSPLWAPDICFASLVAPLHPRPPALLMFWTSAPLTIFIHTKARGDLLFAASPSAGAESALFPPDVSEFI